MQKMYKLNIVLSGLMLLGVPTYVRAFTHAVELGIGACWTTHLIAEYHLAWKQACKEARKQNKQEPAFSDVATIKPYINVNRLVISGVVAGGALVAKVCLASDDVQTDESHANNDLTNNHQKSDAPNNQGARGPARTTEKKNDQKTNPFSNAPLITISDVESELDEDEDAIEIPISPKGTQGTDGANQPQNSNPAQIKMAPNVPPVTPELSKLREALEEFKGTQDEVDMLITYVSSQAEDFYKKNKSLDLSQDDASIIVHYVSAYHQILSKVLAHENIVLEQQDFMSLHDKVFSQELAGLMGAFEYEQTQPQAPSSRNDLASRRLAGLVATRKEINAMRAKYVQEIPMRKIRVADFAQENAGQKEIGDLLYVLEKSGKAGDLQCTVLRTEQLPQGWALRDLVEHRMPFYRSNTGEVVGNKYRHSDYKSHYYESLKYYQQFDLLETSIYLRTIEQLKKENKIAADCKMLDAQWKDTYLTYALAVVKAITAQDGVKDVETILDSVFSA